MNESSILWWWAALGVSLFAFVLAVIALVRQLRFMGAMNNWLLGMRKPPTKAERSEEIKKTLQQWKQE